MCVQLKHARYEHSITADRSRSDFSLQKIGLYWHMACQHLIWAQFTDVLLKLLISCTVSALVGVEVKLECTSEKCPIWCVRKDVLRLNKRNSLPVVSEVAKPSPAPALIALNIFYALNWKNELPALTR